LGGSPWLATVGETNIPGGTTMGLTEETITRPARERSLVPAFVVGTDHKVLRAGYRGYWIRSYQLRVRDVDEMVFIDPS
jgi:hypothetical protein